MRTFDFDLCSKFTEKNGAKMVRVAKQYLNENGIISSFRGTAIHVGTTVYGDGGAVPTVSVHGSKYPLVDVVFYPRVFKPRASLQIISINIDLEEND